MHALLASAVLLPLAYRFDAGSTTMYDVAVTFDGFIPILGGQEGKVLVTMGVLVGGLPVDDKGNIRAYSDIQTAKFEFNSAPLPLSVDSIKAYFPKTTISLSPMGKTLKTDAPDLSLPIKLPGLDIKRFPDITYLPIELPDGGIDEKKSWSFAKPFGETPVTYECTLKKYGEGTADIEIKLNQTYNTLEDASLQVVKSTRDAVNQVKTDLVGKGTAVFDMKLGRVRELLLDATATSQVEDIKTHEKTVRKLNTRLDVKLRTGAVTIPEKEKKGMLLAAWDRAKEMGTTTMARMAIFAAMIRQAFAQAAARVRGN